MDLLPHRLSSNQKGSFSKKLREKLYLDRVWIDKKPIGKTMGKTDKIEDIPEVEIADAGKFKYILIEAKDKDPTFQRPKFLVRGDAESPYHADILDKAIDKIDETKLTLNCVGGGRLRVDPAQKTIFVFGYSQGFGKADHRKTVEILQKYYQQWKIEITDEEY
ncbi:unnamed protein product [Didymodactylos carnosus]|uniref:14 kDa phosphohistidine phosphatase n=1 Tax=Didymodactylos carnosus TaxID=1234261 RepID=A0A814GQ27_9BILA|nr:unnamed protein product [Didymodactylos carnosus]CAF1465528.1 unnamed protein product [Didymodactylos carnosus]CAF3771149.1 unnamed protein product [Didymodactylos carnosus]CAF4258219.1 unnamed protein product [Didymodactylos carnosus]